MPLKPLSLNRIQAIRTINNANVDVCVSGRGTGKSAQKAWRYRSLVKHMPMSVHAIYTKTFKSLLTNTISPVIENLERLGFYRDVDYVIGVKPPKGWDIASKAPASFDYYWSFRNGTGFRFMSEDRSESLRGPSVNGIDVDEALLIDRQKFFNGPIMANRGDNRFYDSSLHHGIQIDSSMPITPKSKWLLELGSYYEDDGHDYWRIWNQVVDRQYRWLLSKDEQEKAELVREWMQLRKQIRFYRKWIKDDKAYHLFSFGNVFDNVENVGIEYIYKALKVSTPQSFRIEMLNERLMGTADSFYAINEDVHIYDAFDNSYLDSLEYNFSKMKQDDCRWDLDLDRDKPLDIAIDFGHHINAMRVAQEHRKDVRTGEPSFEYRYLKTLFVKPPKGLQQLIEQFTSYYLYHKNKLIFLWYDHTAVGGQGWRVPHINETVRLLTERGWKVVLKYIGKAPDHRIKYQLWRIALEEKDPRFPKIRFNRTNDKEGILAMQLTPVKQGNRGIEKDKSSERHRATIPAEQATDLTDAGDLLLIGRYGGLAQSKSSYIGL